MPIIVGDIAGEIARLESLVSALERLGDGEMPTEQELATAPLLDPFGIGSRNLPCLVGGNFGHPTSRGPVIRTLDVWVMAPEQGWARTYGRLYRFSEPMLPEFGGMLSPDPKSIRRVPR